MRIENKFIASVVASTVGLILGLIGGPVQVLIIWAFFGLGIGYISISKKTAMLHGAMYGFVLSYIFMVHGYSGVDPLSSKLIPFIALGLFGALCGLILALFGNFVHKIRLKKS